MCFFRAKILFLQNVFFLNWEFFFLATAAVAEAWHSKCRYQINKIISIFLSNSENIVFYWSGYKFNGIYGLLPKYCII
jgi:hypothetical protein